MRTYGSLTNALNGHGQVEKLMLKFVKAETNEYVIDRPFSENVWRVLQLVGRLTAAKN